ncbi:hypothetical protein [Sorangium sp. So ce1389]|uniref:hypothetical protein n=1 Tax=Sorangium sp. So ce1389 TaxID=3133336 RepID=UPI003F60E087
MPSINTKGGGSPLEVASNNTIQGANSSAKIHGGLTMKNVSNVMIRKLDIQGVWPN